MHRVVVWGTGNAGRPAIRAVAAHRDLELVGAVVANPDKVGRDAGELAFVEPLGVAGTDDPGRALADDVDAVVYTATGDTRPDAALDDLVDCLRAGKDVVSTSFYPLLHPPSAPRALLDVVEPACAEGDSSVFVSGVDPGWALDILPGLVSGVGAGITEIRVQEVFNYALYDQPDVVREIIGFGGPMDETPLMLLDFSLRDGLGADGAGPGRPARGRRSTTSPPTSSAARWSARSRCRAWARSRPARRGRSASRSRASSTARPRWWSSTSPASTTTARPDWQQSTSPGGEHRVQLTGHPNLAVSVHGTEPGEPGAAGGGNASAANRIVNAIPAVVRRAGRAGEPAGPAAHHRGGPARLLSQGVVRHHPGQPATEVEDSAHRFGRHSPRPRWGWRADVRIWLGAVCPRP